MDGTTSPGAWIGWTPWPGAQAAGCASTVVCNCKQPWQNFGEVFTMCAPQSMFQAFTATLQSPPAAAPLSDDDVDRIARRVAEIMREPKP